MTSSCEIDVHQVGDAAVLGLHGEIDSSASAPMAAAYDEALATGDAAGPSRVVLDFADVDYMNSAGIALIVSVLARARAEGRKVVASGLSDHYRQIFAITRLSDFIELQPDLAAAVGVGAVEQSAG
jgi:anti-anti-sigma factor